VYDSNGNEVQKNSNSQVSPTLSASQKTEWSWNDVVDKNTKH
jgi:hypothetical protein